jgi:hypothetical protein
MIFTTVNGAFSIASKNDLDDQNLFLVTVHLPGHDTDQRQCHCHLEHKALRQQLFLIVTSQ